MRNRYRTEEYAINNGDYRTSSPQMDGDEIAQIKAYVDQQDQLIVAQHNADKATQESRDTEQDSKIFQNATDIGINQTSITNLTNKNTEQDARLDALENRPVGTSGSMSVNQLVSEIVITDVNQPIVFDNLDAVVDGGYILTYEIAQTTENLTLNICLNDDKVPENYKRITYGFQNTPVGTESDSNPLSYTPLGHTAFVSAEISSSGKVISECVRTDEAGLASQIYTKIPTGNINKIELTSVGIVPIDSRFSLYKRKTEIKPSLVQEVVLDADATSIVFDNLDAVADGGYELIFESGLASQSSLISVYLNNDDIPTNYSRILSNINPNSSTPAVVHDEKPVISNTIPNKKTLSTTDISISGIIRSFVTRTDDVNMDIGVYSKTSTTNITKLELRADVANGIPSGTKATLYRRKHDIGSGMNSGGADYATIEYVDTADANLQAQIDALSSSPIGASGSISMNQLVSEIIITDENQTVVFDNLDAVTDGGYIMTIDNMQTTETSSYSIVLNDDTIPTNYRKSYYGYYAPTNVNSFGTNETNVFLSTAAGYSSFGSLEISPSGKMLSHMTSSVGTSFTENIVKKVTLDNVTKIELVSNVSIPIDSRFSLYKRKTEIKPSLVEEVVLDADSTSIVFDNLDAVADGGYELIFESATATATCPVQMFFNDDVIATNYQRTRVQSSGSMLDTSVDEVATVMAMENGRNHYAKMDISERGRVKSSLVRTDGISQENYMHKKTALNNINKIEIKSDVVNAIPTGTKASLYRRKHDMVSGVNISSRAEGATDSTQLTIANATTESLSGTATSQSEVNAEFVTEVSEHETRITTLEASSGSSGSYQLGDIILQNSEWVNDFVEINGMTFVKCNGVAVESSLYPFIGTCSLVTPLASAKKPINMTSNNTPEPYVVNSDGYYSSYYPWEAFDGVENVVGWGSLEEYGGWISIDLGTVTNVNGYDVNFAPAVGGSVDAPKDWVFQGSDDGINWVTVDTRTGQTGWASPSTRHFDITGTSSFRMYRMNISSIQDSGTHAYIGEISLYVSGAFETPTLYITDPNTTQNIYYYMRIK